MTGNQNIYGAILLLGALINVGLNLILIPESNPLSDYGIRGINGAAFASMCSLSFWNLSMVLVVKKKFGFYTFYIPFLKR
jgi:Na+-driven multidrug efflux pump